MENDKNWTVDPKTHRYNSSSIFNFLEEKITEIINESAFDLVSGENGHRSVAGLILANLAHKYGMKPSFSLEEMKKAEGKG